jgi:CubicO group peptidase (beta-lactamase class C family)
MRFAPIALPVGLLVQAFGAPAPSNSASVDRIFAAFNRPGSPGCALGVIHNGTFIYRKGYGEGSLELDVPLLPESVFYVGSISKQFTAASIVLAAEQGFLSLDDNVRKYVPELPDYGRPITLRQMLHHTSGLRDFETLLYLSGRDASDLHSKDEMIALIVRQKGLNNPPGDAFLYSNTNYFLLAEVVHRATGKSLAQFADENIFRPLRMTHTRFYDDHNLVVPGRVSAYDPGPDGKFTVDWSTNFDLVGAGGLMSSVDDLLAWDSSFYNNQLGKGTLIRELETRGQLNNGKTIDYALGLELTDYRGLRVVDHSGSLFGYRSEIIRFPDQRFTVVCLCNVSSADTNSLSRQVADVYLAKELQQAVSATDVPNSRFPDPSQFTGEYLDPQRHFLYSFTASSGNLMAWGGILRRLGANQFRDLGTGIITFDNSNHGMTATLIMDGETFFSGNRIQAPHLTEADLSTYAGVYKSSELDAAYNLSPEKDGLRLRAGWNPSVKLAPVAPDEFNSPDLGTIVFHRDADHRIISLSVFTVNARDVRFDKVS